MPTSRKSQPLCSMKSLRKTLAIVVDKKVEFGMYVRIKHQKITQTTTTEVTLRLTEKPKQLLSDQQKKLRPIKRPIGTGRLALPGTA